jgi:hypothetical protein
VSRPAAGAVDRSFLARRQQALAANDGRDSPFAEGLRHLEDWEAALVELCRREPDPETLRMLDVFRERRADVIEWLAEITTAKVVPFPVERVHAAHPEPRSLDSPGLDADADGIDLRTVDLPFRPVPQSPDTAVRRPTPEVEL